MENHNFCKYKLQITTAYVIPVSTQRRFGVDTSFFPNVNNVVTTLKQRRTLCYVTFKGTKSYISINNKTHRSEEKFISKYLFTCAFFALVAWNYFKRDVT